MLILTDPSDGAPFSHHATYQCGTGDYRTWDAKYCFECGQYPCNQIKRMDNRYRNNYKMSIKDNLENIKKLGINKFIDDQYNKYHCATCKGLISIHNNKCFSCEAIIRLVEKDSKKC